MCVCLCVFGYLGVCSVCICLLVFVYVCLFALTLASITKIVI